MNIKDWWCKQTDSIYHWFRDGRKYSRFELIINWLIILIPSLIFIITIIALACRWKYFIGAINGTYPLSLWCPVWVGVILALLVCALVSCTVMKFQQRRRRLKYHRATINNKPDKYTGTFVDKVIDRDYKTVEDKSGKRKTFD